LTKILKFLEELAALAHLKDDICALTTEGGAPALLGSKGLFAAVIKKDAEESRNSVIMVFHCVVYQENLCKILQWLSTCDE
jgi:hypothetical protein